MSQPVSPVPSPQLVVGAAILSDLSDLSDLPGGGPGRDGAARSVLVGERSAPPHLAGYWEFPGGKVEPEEDDRAALVRECREELGVVVEVLDRLGADLPIGAGGTATLRVFTARIAAGAVTLSDHRQVRWLSADEVDDVRWIPSNRPLLGLLRSVLGASGGSRAG